MTYIRRGKKFAKSVTAFAIDIDGTDKIDRVVAHIHPIAYSIGATRFLKKR